MGWYGAAMISPPDAHPGEPSLRFVIWTAVALLVAYHAAVLIAFGALPSPRIGLFAAGPVFLLLPLFLGIPAAERRAGLRLRAVPLPAVLAAAAGTVALLPAAFSASSLLVPEPDALDDLFAEILRGDSVAELGLVFLGAAVAPAFSEEIFFRGFVQRGLERRLGRWPGIVVTAAVFGILHGAVRAPVIAALGVLFGWMASRSGSVWPSIVAHAATNGIAIAVVNLTDPSGLADAPAAAMGAILVAGAATGAGFLAAFARSITAGKENGPSPPGEAPPPSHPAG
jgi:membrane protease YdiL (CAAX protease family)